MRKAKSCSAAPVASSTSTSTSTFTKLGADGRFLFTTDFGNSDYPPQLIAGDSAGNVFVGGDKMVGTATSWEVFVRRFDASGVEQNRWPIASDDRDVAYEMAVDASGAAIVVGDAAGTLPGQTAFGGHDAFVARISP